MRVIDLAASSLLAVAVAGAAVAWTGASGHVPAERVEQAGSSFLLGRRVQHAAYWAAGPVGRALVRAGASANGITIASVPLAAGAALAFAGEHWGVGALLGAAAYACDALDGLVARITGTASKAGEILDAVCDRICETLMLGGVTVAWRASVPLLALVLFAALGAQQVTLASAKTEVFPSARGHVPRGVMRRAERAVYFMGGAAIAGALHDLGVDAARLPLILALGLVGILGNASALHRFASLARVLRQSAAEVHHAGR
jgi:CDP-diacylglycerol---glycerol-3-phosphate 3-phosphatidyltransferase